MSEATGLMAVGIEVSDLARSSAFYTERLGFRVQQEVRLEYIDEDILVLPKTQAALVLMQHKDGSHALNGPPAAKVVVNVPDVRALVESLRSAGCAIVREPDEFPGFGLIAFSQDPDGYDIEMIQRIG